jgi:hypothetical protein
MNKKTDRIEEIKEKIAKPSYISTAINNMVKNLDLRNIGSLLKKYKDDK